MLFDTREMFMWRNLKEKKINDGIFLLPLNDVLRTALAMLGYYNGCVVVVFAVVCAKMTNGLKVYCDEYLVFVRNGFLHRNLVCS